jgi:hypothetical protein
MSDIRKLPHEVAGECLDLLLAHDQLFAIEALIEIVGCVLGALPSRAQRRAILKLLQTEAGERSRLVATELRAAPPSPAPSPSERPALLHKP